MSCSNPITLNMKQLQWSLEEIILNPYFLKQVNDCYEIHCNDDDDVVTRDGTNMDELDTL